MSELATPPAGEPVTAAVRELPSAIERLVTHAWRTVLHVDTVGPESDFFQLGGHSLTAMHLGAMLERELGRAIPLEVIFEHSTLGELAGHLAATAPLHQAAGSSENGVVA